jgi:heterodisulfide reductase subunit B
MNLAAYQKKISRQWGRDLSISILHLPQLLGLALGMTETELGLDQNLAIKDEFKAKVFEEKITT